MAIQVPFNISSTPLAPAQQRLGGFGMGLSNPVGGISLGSGTATNTAIPQPVGAFTPQAGLGQTQIHPAASGVIDAGFNPPPPKGGFPDQNPVVTGGNIQPQTQQTGLQQPQQQFGLSGFENSLGQGFAGA